VGLARTGKSTYLGALWMIIQDPRASFIREVDVRGDRSYLTQLGEQVSLLKEMTRTDVNSDEGLELIVELGEFGELNLQIPDLSGETLRLLVEDRAWHDLLRRAFTDSDALLLFVHPDRLRIPIRTNFTADVLDELMTAAPEDEGEDSDRGVDSGASEPDETSEDEDGDKAPVFSPRLASTAAKLIDAIENLLDARIEGSILKVGIIISAWDVVEKAWPTDGGKPTPRAWLEHRLPAVWQVLRANSNRVDIAVFGVSAIGGRLPDDREKLKEKGAVLDRAYAVDEEGRGVTLVAPLEWAVT
jgi:hypothetical protein